MSPQCLLPEDDEEEQEEQIEVHDAALTRLARF
jgi:hypothetical protein